MSARAPFVPRPASRLDLPAADKPQPPSSAPQSYEPFRANGLLSAPEPQVPAPQQHPLSPSEAPPRPSSAFRPLNLSGLAKVKSSSRAQNVLSFSADSSGFQSRSPKSISSQPKHPAVARPSSPFFPNASLVSMNAFLSPNLHSRPRESPQNEDFSSNQAHIVAQDTTLPFDDRQSTQNQLLPAQDAGSLRFFDPPLAAPRSRTASHPSLASIHEVDEDVNASSRHAQSMGPPPPPDLGSFGESGLGLHHIDRRSPFLRRPTKRTEPALENGEELEYGTSAKRYKSVIDEVRGFLLRNLSLLYFRRTSINLSITVERLLAPSMAWDSIRWPPRH